MRSRRIILTLECQTVYTLAEIRAALTHVALSHGRWITRYPDGETGDGMPNRIVQVQANAIKPESKKARWAKFAKEDARLAAADQLKAHIAKVWGGEEPNRTLLDFMQSPQALKLKKMLKSKAKRAKGAK